MVDLIRITVDNNGQITGVTSIWLALLILVAVVVIAVFFRWSRYSVFRQEFEVNEVELGIGNGKIKFKPTSEDLQVAYGLWVELKTRKLGLPFEEDHDVIVEVYNSWYEFFRITRELIKSIPVSRIAAKPSTQRLVKISIDVLNMAVRPHLTKWQARFRRWYQTEIEKPENASLSPQELQRKFPEYQVLIADLKATNSRLVAYAYLLSRLIDVDFDKQK